MKLHSSRFDLRHSKWILLCLLWLFAPAAAQTNLGGISGTVVDQNGAIVPGARVTVTNAGTNRSTTLTTSEEGAYAATLLQPALYRITVEAVSFKRAIVDSVKVDTATTTTANVTLETGAISEASVTVTAESPLFNTESGVTSQTITERQIRDLPVANRSVLDLALTVPNVSGFTGSEDPAITTGLASPGSGLNISGGRPGETTILADGVSNTSVGTSRQVVSFTPDVVQEFTVQTSAFSAEYGQTGGGVINTTTKSGTNRFSGTLYAFNRNPVFAAGPFTTAIANRPRNELRQNNFGAIIGGPIYLPRFGEGGQRFYNGRDRSFFFFAFEPRYSSDSDPIDGLQPTEAMRRGDFSNAVSVPGGIADRTIAQQMGITNLTDIILYRQFDLVNGQLRRITLAPGESYPRFANNLIPREYLDATSQNLLQYVPQAGSYFLSSVGVLRNYSSTRYVVRNEKRYTLRLDHRLSANNSLNGRYSVTPILGVRGAGAQETIVNARGTDFSASRQVLIGDTHAFTPTLINDLKLNYTRGNYTRTNPPEFQTRNFSTELGLPSGAAAGLPNFIIGVGTIGQADITGANGLRDAIEETFNIANTLSYVRGNKTFKFGADLRHQRQKQLVPSTYQGGEYTFAATLTNSAPTNGVGGLNFATFLLGVPSQVNLRSAVVPYYYRWNSASFFVQNDWKVRPNLTLNLGVRYSLQLPRTEKYDLQGSFLPDAASAASVPQGALCRIATNPCPAASVVALPAGLLPAQTLVPAFAYSGRGGRSRYLTPVDYNNLEPRFGFAYTPKIFGLNNRDGRALILRGGYGVSHSVLTGQDRFATPDLGGTIDETYALGNGGVDPNFALRLATNPPSYSARPANLNIPANGLVEAGSIFLPGDRTYIDPNTEVPAVHSYNLSLSYELMRNTIVEIAYVGNYSNNLFFPGININTQSAAATTALINAGLDPNSTVIDPLRRISATGGLATVRLGSIAAPFLGFANLDRRYQASAANISNAGYVSVQRRFNSGLSFTANYTFGKTINEASDSGNAFGLGGGAGFTTLQLGYGGTERGERAVANYDVTHNFVSTFLYELPFGRGRALLNNAPRLVDALLGGYQISGVARARSGFPIRAVLADSNLLGVVVGGQIGAQARVRPNLVPGVPLINPFYDRKCPVGTGCEPYINPAAFQRPPKGQIGNAPRTFSGDRWPGQRFFDVSLQRNFRFGQEGKRSLQLRADFFNVLNHPTFRFSPNLATSSIVNLPSEADISTAEYDAWQRANPAQPLRTTPAGAALFTNIQNLTRNARGGVTGQLPADFFSVPLTGIGNASFSLTNVNSYDITTLQGLKLFRLRQQLVSGFGNFDVAEEMRTIQFAVKFYF